MPSVKPALRAALVTSLTTAMPGVSVRYGGGFTDTQVGAAVMVGAAGDPFDENDTVVDSTTYTIAGTGPRQDETGDINCVAMSWNGNPGDAGVQQAYEDTYALLASVETYLRNNPTVGGFFNGTFWAEYGTEVTTREFDNGGPVCVVAFTIHYRARF
jgi:hypothetical protein